MKNIKIEVAIIIGAVIIGLAIFFLGNKADIYKIIYNGEELNSELYTDSEELKNDFMEGCMEEGGNYQFCNCGFNELLNDIGVEGMTELGLELIAGDDDGKHDGSLWKAVDNCFYLY